MTVYLGGNVGYWSRWQTLRFTLEKAQKMTYFMYPPPLLFLTQKKCFLEPVNSKLDWTGTISWPPSLKPNRPSTGLQVQSPSIVFVGAVDTIFPRLNVFILIYEVMLWFMNL